MSTRGLAPESWQAPTTSGSLGHSCQVMAFSQISQFMSGGGSQNAPTEDNGSQTLGQQMGLDSITLGQLRAMVNSAPKPKV